MMSFLPWKRSPSRSHEIYIINEPPFEDDSPRPRPHDEFEEYYKILRDIPNIEQFSLDHNSCRSRAGISSHTVYVRALDQ